MFPLCLVPHSPKKPKGPVMHWKEDSPITLSPKVVGSNTEDGTPSFNGRFWPYSHFHCSCFLHHHDQGSAAAPVASVLLHPDTNVQMSLKTSEKDGEKRICSVSSDFPGQARLRDPAQSSDVSCCPCVLAKPEKALTLLDFHCPP